MDKLIKQPLNIFTIEHGINVNYLFMLLANKVKEFFFIAEKILHLKDDFDLPEQKINILKRKKITNSNILK